MKLSSAYTLGLLFLLPLPAQGAKPTADEAYQAARTGYYALKGDAARRKFRHNWLNVAKKFEQVAARYPKSPRAPEALYTSGELLAELSRFSAQQADLDAAVGDYRRLVDGYPRHALADDASLALARIEVDRRDDVPRAREVIAGALAANPRGDRTRELKALLASLPTEAPKRAARPGTPASPPAGAAKRAAQPPPASLAAEAPKRAAQPPPASPPAEAAKRAAQPATPARSRIAALSEAIAKATARTAAADAEDDATEGLAHGSAAKPVSGATEAPASGSAAKPSAGVPSGSATGSPAKPPAVGAAARGPEQNAPAAAAAPGTAARLVDADDEGGEADEPEVPAPRPPMPALERVQERLRAVRVGEPREEPPHKVDARLAKARLRQAAKDERGAEMTLAEQLGLKVRRVVIDAGHGGHDSGAVGARGTREKDVTLAIATKLSERLTEAGLEVLLTRDDDTFVRLEDRAKLANEAHGDLFISVHCNSAPGKTLRGVETYTLNTSSDRYSIRLAARENASSEKGISDLQFILADLATKANTEESSRLALKVQRGLVGALRQSHKEVRDLGNKEALFYVLLGAKMPAILVETSFLSNPAEEQLLATPAYQDEVAAAIAAGVQDFLGDRQRLAKVD